MHVTLLGDAAKPWCVLATASNFGGAQATYPCVHS